MSSVVKFLVTEHVIPCQHMREFPHGAKNDRAVLQLAIKEYRPLKSSEREGGITIIAAHATGFPKELYEPIWNDLFLNSSPTSPNIRSIWIADMANHGASGILNEAELGDDPSWFDHSRDLLHMVNTFREHMIPPIIGIGHSMGACQISRLAHLHPRLFHSIALIEPIIQQMPRKGPSFALGGSLRKDYWLSKSLFEKSISRSPFFESWDPRVLQLYLKYTIRQVPTHLYPSNENKDAVTLTTTKHQESWTYFRTNFEPLSQEPKAGKEEYLLHPEKIDDEYIFGRPEAVIESLDLPRLRPRVLWIYSQKSPINHRAIRTEILATTGIGNGGSGGATADKVEEILVPGAAHLLPFEQPNICADILGSWMGRMASIYFEEAKLLASYNSRRSERNMSVLSKEWMDAVKKDSGLKRNVTQEKL